MIMVDIYFPSVDCEYSFRLDENVKVLSLVQEIQEMMCKKYKSQIGNPDDQFMLCTLEGNRVLANNTTLFQNGIMNGDRLMLV